MLRQPSISTKRIRLHASEIGQYHFCPASWYLHRCGFKPDSEHLGIGLKKHASVGRTLSRIDHQNRLIRFLRFTALGIILTAVFILIIEVISSMI